MRLKAEIWYRLISSQLGCLFALLGSEFINFISTMLTCRMLRKARGTGLLEKVSYGELLDDLSSAWRMVDSPEVPATDDGFWVHTLSYVFDELEALGLSKPIPKPAPKKRGRPRKNPVEDKPKRPRGLVPYSTWFWKYACPSFET